MKEEDLIENFFKNHDISKIIENEFNIFLKKIINSKLQWITKCQQDVEYLVHNYSKMKDEKLKLINERYDEELKEIEENINKSNIIVIKL